MLTLNEALKYAGLPQRKLDEAKKRLSSDELKAKLLSKAKGDLKNKLEAANFRYVGRGVEHVDDRYQDENSPYFNEQSDTYDSNVDGWYIRAVVYDDGNAGVVWSKKQERHSSYDDDEN